MENMPEIVPNMLIEDCTGDFYLIANFSEKGNCQYRIQFKKSTGNVVLAGTAEFTQQELRERTERIYAAICCGTACPLSQMKLAHIMAGTPVGRGYLRWERSHKVKEVTMADVCEKFGCEVKIVKD